MASVTFTIAAQSKTFTVSSGDITRITNALRAYYIRANNGVSLTGAEVFELYANNAMQRLKTLVKNEEGEPAAQAARDAVADVQAT